MKHRKYSSLGYETSLLTMTRGEHFSLVLPMGSKKISLNDLFG